MDIILLFAIVFANARVAGRKGKNPVVWGLFTLGAFLLTAMIFGGMFLMMGYKGPMTPEAIQEYGMSLQKDFLKGLTVAMFGLGGGLVIRYLLQRMPDGSDATPPDA